MLPASDRLARAIDHAERLGSGAATWADLDGVADAIVVTDSRLDAPGPTITFANAAFETLTGYDRTELVGRSPRLLQGFDTDLAELRRMKAALTGGDLFEGLVLNYNKAGMEYVVGWAIAPIRGAGDRIEQWISIQNDVLKDARVARAARDAH